MKKYIYILIFFVFLIIPNVGYASRSCTPSNPKYNAMVEIEKEAIAINEKVSINVDTGSVDNNVHYKVNQSGFIEISNEGIITALKDGNVIVDVTVDFLEEDEIKGSCKLTIPITIVSNDSSLKSLTLEEYDFSQIFQSNKYEYEVKLPYRIEKINIIAEANNENAKITGSGRRYLNEGTNEYNIVVTASDGSTSTYKITILRDEANNDSTLSNLIVEGYVLNPKFSKDIFSYSLDVGKDVDKIKINAIPSYEHANIKGSGTFTVATGKNTYYIVVTAENGDEKKYEIVINKSEGLGKLTKLLIEGFDLNTSFNSDIFIYTLTVSSDIESLKIKTETSNNEQVEIIGNDKLKNGENEIVIKVTGNDKTTTTYKILVNKLSKEEEIQIKENNTLLKILLIIFIVSITIMFVFIVLFIKRNFKRKYTLNNRKSKNSRNKK